MTDLKILKSWKLVILYYSKSSKSQSKFLVAYRDALQIAPFKNPHFSPRCFSMHLTPTPFFTKHQEQGQSEGVGTWFLLICKAWQMDICKLSIKISGTSDRSHPTRWSYVILKLNDLHISSQLILCLALLTVSALHLQAGLSLKPHSPLPLSLSMRIYSPVSLSLSIRATGPLEAECSCRSLALCFLYALRKGALVCCSVPGPLSLALLPDSDVPSPLEWEDEPGEEQGLGKGTDCTVITSKTQEEYHAGLGEVPLCSP